jgi:hypothetical protein
MANEPEAATRRSLVEPAYYEGMRGQQKQGISRGVLGYAEFIRNLK